MKNIQLNLNTFAFCPGTSIEGNITSDPTTTNIDSISANFRGEIIYHKTGRTKPIVGNEKQVWKRRTLGQLLGMEEYDENQNKENPTVSTYPISLRIPENIPPSFSGKPSPITIRYFLEVSIHDKNGKIASLEEGIVIVPKQNTLISMERALEKNFEFKKGRSIFISFEIEKDIFTSTGNVEAKISLCNRWKQSLKYVHMNIVKKMILYSEGNEPTVTRIDTTGVGLPNEKLKIGVGESYTFRPTFNVPALPPTTNIQNLIQVDYCLKLSVGRCHNYILSILEIPIKIIPNNGNCEKGCAEGVLIDLRVY